MATINLLPWRDELRQEKKREFFSILGLLITLMALVGYVWVSFVEGQVKHQQSRNALYQQEISLLDRQVKEIAGLKKQREELESKIEVIQGLQNKRPLIVYYFDNIVRAVPDGVYFKGLSRKENLYTIKGISESNTRVSTLMRNLDASEYFQLPNLKNVVKDAFELSVGLKVPSEFVTMKEKQ
jgi:type IV pilus assembly protein PilN